MKQITKFLAGVAVVLALLLIISAVKFRNDYTGGADVGNTNVLPHYLILKN